MASDARVGADNGWPVAAARITGVRKLSEAELPTDKGLPVATAEMRAVVIRPPDPWLVAALPADD